MASRSKKLYLEALEGRELLSHVAALPAADISLIARAGRKTKYVVGSIDGVILPPNGWSASGKLPVLGVVNMSTTIPINGGQQGYIDATITLATGRGKLTFAALETGGGPIDLKVAKGTKTYAKWHGSGTVSIIWNEFGYLAPEPTFQISFDLKLKT